MPYVLANFDEIEISCHTAYTHVVSFPYGFLCGVEDSRLYSKPYRRYHTDELDCRVSEPHMKLLT